MAPLYDEFISTFRWQYKHLSDKLPWRSVAAPGVFLHKKGALQRSYTLRGPDLSHEIQEAQGAAMLQANDVLKRLPGDWWFHGEAQRVPVNTYPETLWPSPVARLIDEDRRHAIVHQPGSFETFYFFNLSWKPPAPSTHRMERWAVSRPPAEDALTPDDWRARAIQTFVTQGDHWMDLLRGVLAQARPLMTDEAATYLNTTVNPPPWGPISCRWGLDLDVRLAQTRVVPGWYPYWDVGPEEQVHFRVCSLTGYPQSTTVKMMREVYKLGIPFRLVTRGIALDKEVQENLIRKVQGQWYGERQSVFGRMSENLSQERSAIQNSDAINKAQQADAARQEIGEDLVLYMNASIIGVVWDTQRQRADEKLRELCRVFQAQGFGVTFEKHHAMAMWFASHPGNRVDGVRKYPQNTLMLAQMTPGLQDAYTGETRDPYLKDGPWYHAHTDEHTIYRVVMYVRDLPHFFVPGPTRSGKSTLLGLKVAQWLKAPNRQCFLFDVGRTARCLTYGLGGQWHDLGSGQVGLQPFLKIDRLVDRAKRVEWALRRLEEHHIALDDHARLTINLAMDKMLERPRGQRTMTEWVNILTALNNVSETGSRNASSPYASRLLELSKVQSRMVHTFTEYTQGHMYGILDGQHHDLDQGRFHTFEQKSLLKTPLLAPAVLQLLFMDLEERFGTSTPTLMPMDDAAVTWVLPDWEQRGRVWLTTLAKEAVSLGFFTHSLVQIFGSQLGTLILESCPQIFALPNRSALAPELAQIYERIGFNHEEIVAIAKARPQRDVYYACEEYGKRLLSLPLSPLLVALLASNRDEDHEAMTTILNTHGPEHFAEHWLHWKGFPNAAAQVRQWRDEQEDMGDAAD